MEMYLCVAVFQDEDGEMIQTRWEVVGAESGRDAAEYYHPRVENIGYTPRGGRLMIDTIRARIEDRESFAFEDGKIMEGVDNRLASLYNDCPELKKENG